MDREAIDDFLYRYSGLKGAAEAQDALSELRKAAEGWRPIETAPEVKGEYFFCRVAWGHEADKCTGDGFRWNNRWFAAATFYNNAPFGECQHEMRQIEVHPTHWAPRPAEPNTALSQYRRES